MYYFLPEHSIHSWYYFLPEHSIDRSWTLWQYIGCIVHELHVRYIYCTVHNLLYSMLDVVHELAAQNYWRALGSLVCIKFSCTLHICAMPKFFPNFMYIKNGDLLILFALCNKRWKLVLPWFVFYFCTLKCCFLCNANFRFNWTFHRFFVLKVVFLNM